jgi:hypothetical protein
VIKINAAADRAKRGRLLCAELVARGIDGWVYNSVQTPCITAEAVLPSFQRRQAADGYLWPRWRLVRGPARAGASASMRPLNERAAADPPQTNRTSRGGNFRE